MTSAPSTLAAHSSTAPTTPTGWRRTGLVLTAVAAVFLLLDGVLHLVRPHAVLQAAGELMTRTAVLLTRWTGSLLLVLAVAYFVRVAHSPDSDWVVALPVAGLLAIGGLALLASGRRGRTKRDAGAAEK